MKPKQPGIVAILLVISTLSNLFLIACNAQVKEGNNQEAVKVSANINIDSFAGSANNATGDWNTSGFNYIEEKVENGTLHGVVEVGASGFNSFVVNMDNKKRWKIVSKDFGRSFVYEGAATTDDIRAGLIKYRAAMAAKGVSEKNMYFVVSSGAQKGPNTLKIISELSGFGYEVNTVTPEQEAVYALKATLPRMYYDNSFMVDLGSGNTKISWDEEGRLKSMELPGSRYHEKGGLEADIYNRAKALIRKLPPEKGDVCFIIGGVPRSLAGQHRKGEERYTVLKAPQDYKANDKKMASGLNIYKAIVDGTQTDTFVFDWEANFAIGFLLSVK